MVFTSLHFALFFIVVYAIYRVLPHRPQNWLLLVASYYFYGVWDWRFLSLIVGSTIVDYAVALAIERAEDPVRRKRLLWLSLAFNFGMLGFFKYFNFFADGLGDLFALAGWRLDPVTLRVILPIGLTTEWIARISPPSISSDIALSTCPSGSRTTAPGRPLIST